MRVIGGSSAVGASARPSGPGVRPTSDRVREAIFDILGSLGGLEDAEVVDLFAGSGALGIEALVAGGASVTFVERDPPGGRRDQCQPRRGLDGCRGGGAKVVVADVDAWVGATGSVSTSRSAIPPTPSTGWETLLDRLPADLAVLESGRELAVRGGVGGPRVYRYGSTLVTRGARAGPARRRRVST